MRNAVRKLSRGKTVTLERRNLGNREELKLLTQNCPGCGLCVNVCPVSAIDLMPAVISNVRLVKKPEIDIDPKKCLFCGACVAMCPQNALELTRNGEPRIPLQEMGTMPQILKSISVEIGRCDLSCGLTCQNVCPTRAIEVKATEAENGSKTVKSIAIDPRMCNFCGKCEYECGFDSINVKKPYAGTAELRSEKCRSNCRICAEICPTKAIKQEDSGKTILESSFCTFCKACEEVCPEKAIHVEITRVNTSGERSGTWFSLLERLTSTEKLTTELSKVAALRRRKSVSDRLL